MSVVGGGWPNSKTVWVAIGGKVFFLLLEIGLKMDSHFRSATRD